MTPHLVFIISSLLCNLLSKNTRKLLFWFVSWKFVGDNVILIELTKLSTHLSSSISSLTLVVTPTLLKINIINRRVSRNIYYNYVYILFKNAWYIIITQRIFLANITLISKITASNQVELIMFAIVFFKYASEGFSVGTMNNRRYRCRFAEGNIDYYDDDDFLAVKITMHCPSLSEVISLNLVKKQRRVSIFKPIPNSCDLCCHIYTSFKWSANDICCGSNLTKAE